MSAIKVTTTNISDSGGGNTTTDNDEIKIFECEKHEEDNNDRLSPVIKEEEVRINFRNFLIKLSFSFSRYLHQLKLVIILSFFFV